jgi:hypothetical protein
MKRLSVPAILLAMALSAFSPAAAAAAQPGDTGTTLTATGNCRVGGAALLVNVVAGLCNTEVLNDSLNNLLQNADIHVLENILNNSPILNDLDITVTDIDVLAGGVNITLLGGTVITIPTSQ